VRLFVAAEIGARLASQAEDLIDALRKRVAEQAPRTRVTWLTVARLHITITFIGNLDRGRVEAVVSALEPPLHVPPLDLSLAGAGVFPQHGPPRAVWAGIGLGRESLMAAEREVVSRLAGIGIGGEDRPYRPHLTLARVREAAGLRSTRLFDGLEQNSLGTTRIDAITLFESRLSPTGPTYVPMLRTSLAGPT